MTGAGALGALLARVEAAMGPDRKIDQDLYCDLGLCPRGEDGVFDAYRAPRYTESLDAAVALVERQLPGWPTILTTMPEAKIPSRYVAKVIFMPPEEKAWGIHHEAGGASITRPAGHPCLSPSSPLSSVPSSPGPN